MHSSEQIDSPGFGRTTWNENLKCLTDLFAALNEAGHTNISGPVPFLSLQRRKGLKWEYSCEPFLFSPPSPSTKALMFNIKWTWNSPCNTKQCSEVTHFILKQKQRTELERRVYRALLFAGCCWSTHGRIQGLRIGQELATEGHACQERSWTCSCRQIPGSHGMA